MIRLAVTLASLLIFLIRARPSAQKRQCLLHALPDGLGAESIDGLKNWYAQGESNPCYRRERAVS